MFVYGFGMIKSEIILDWPVLFKFLIDRSFTRKSVACLSLEQNLILRFCSQAQILIQNRKIMTIQTIQTVDRNNSLYGLDGILVSVK